MKKNKLMLAMGWIIVPIALAIICILVAVYMIRSDQDHKSPSWECNVPPVEEPIVSILEYQTRENPDGTYLCMFKSTGGYTFVQTANEIVERCTRHQQKIPYIVGSDLAMTIEYPLYLGDDLLVIV